MDFDLFREGEQFSFLGPHFNDLDTNRDHIFNISDFNLSNLDVFCDSTNMTCDSDISNNKEDLQKIMDEWQQVLDVQSNCDDFDIEDTMKFTEEELATASLNIMSHFEEEKQEVKRCGKKIDLEAQKYIVDEEECEVDVETISENGEKPSVLEASDVNSLLEQFEATQLPKIENTEVKTVQKEKKTARHKQIVDALPQELIDRIKESGKKKPISVIPPIAPNRKRSKNNENVKQNLKKIEDLSHTVQLDHNYCSQSVKVNYCKKDSGFESAEEEEPRHVIGNQPVVKNADGKVMVSLLKVNSINNQAKKRRLNLEEYKKRRECFLKSQSNSQNSSPFSSTCSSPLPEDDETKLKKHQEKLERMAMEVLNAHKRVKKDKEPERPSLMPIPNVLLPSDVEKITLVSIGVNTELIKKKNLDPLAPVEQLEQIKPLLKEASNKINCNSLITSLIENIPKVIDSCTLENGVEMKTKCTETEHGEDKTIVYLPKKREKKNGVDVGIQTNISLIEQTKDRRYRRRSRSSSSSSSGDVNRSRYSKWYNSDNSTKSKRSRSSSSSSSSLSRSRSSSTSSSSSSTYCSRESSRCSSNSRSLSRSRRERRQIEHLREVEERRVIYVGNLGFNITRADLRKRFQRFGPITYVSLHSRDNGDHYGFVTFVNKLDAYNAIERGNDDPSLPRYDISFGGRRVFCKTTYSDLDNMREDGPFMPQRTEESFDALLREVQEKLRKRRT